MAAKKSNPAMDFIVDSLKSDRGAKYGDIAAAAAKKKLKIYPIMFGRAQAMLGIVKLSPRGEGKMARAKAARTATRSASASASTGTSVVKRGPGRPRKNPVVAFDSIEGIVSAVKSSEQAKNRYRAALERIQSILTDVLS